MKKSDKKILKIVDVMNSYCVFVGATDTTINLKKESKGHIITIVSDFNLKHLHSYVSKLNDILNQPKDPTMEQMFGNLIGNTEFQDDNDVYVIASLIDEASVKIDGNHLMATIKVYK